MMVVMILVVIALLLVAVLVMLGLFRNVLMLSHTELPPSSAPAVPPAAVQGLPQGKQHRDGHQESRLTRTLAMDNI